MQLNVDDSFILPNLSDNIVFICDFLFKQFHFDNFSPTNYSSSDPSSLFGRLLVFKPSPRSLTMSNYLTPISFFLINMIKKFACKVSEQPQQSMRSIDRRCTCLQWFKMERKSASKSSSCFLSKLWKDPKTNFHPLFEKTVTYFVSKALQKSESLF